MQGAVRQLSAVRQENRRLALCALHGIELFRAQRSPALVHQLQTWLRSELLLVEMRLSDLKARRSKRPARIRALRRRGAEGPHIGEHNNAMRVIEEMLTARRYVIRATGDALAWLLLGGRPELIAPLCAPRAHYLTPGVGLMGVVILTDSAHATGKFYVIENDLTRCLGQGDVTIIPAAGPWRHPLCLEVKSSGVEGALNEVEINLSGPLSDAPEDVALHSAFTEALGLNIGSTRSPDVRGRAQMNDMQRRAETLIQLAQPRGPAVRPDRPGWRVLGNVIDRALQTGTAFDILESGVGYLAIRTGDEDDFSDAMAQIVERMQDSGFPAGETAIDTVDLRKDGPLAALVAPVHLWPLEAAQRALILAGDVFVAAVFRRSVWREAFAAEGMTLDDSGRQWRIEHEGSVSNVAPLDVLMLRAGIAFGGVSPRALARSIREAAAAL